MCQSYRNSSKVIGSSSLRETSSFGLPVEFPHCPSLIWSPEEAGREPEGQSKPGTWCPVNGGEDTGAAGAQGKGSVGRKDGCVSPRSRGGASKVTGHCQQPASEKRRGGGQELAARRNTAASVCGGMGIPPPPLFSASSALQQLDSSWHCMPQGGDRSLTI